MYTISLKATIVVDSIEIYSLSNESNEWDTQTDLVGTRTQNVDGRSWKHECEKRHNLCDQIEVNLDLQTR